MRRQVIVVMNGCAKLVVPLEAKGGETWDIVFGVSA